MRAGRTEQKTKILLRKGTYSKTSGKGFGWAKIKTRHGIKKDSTVKHPTKSPYGAIWKGRPQTKAEYTAYADNVRKIDGKWIVVEETPVRTVVEFKHVSSHLKVKLNNAPGVLTTYRINPNRALKCPSWVDSAFLPSNNGVVGAMSPRYDGATTYSSSYTPRRIGQVLN
ncbi:hypothetical protein [Leucobacter sp.]